MPEALEILTQEEAARLVDMENVAREAIHRAEQSGIVFIDEIDKIAGRESAHGPDVSREGVQRDLLPIVEGSTVNTKYGAVRTDHILFVASGAFHTSKPSDLIPEFQGRFPIRVELKALTTAGLRPDSDRTRKRADQAICRAARHREGEHQFHAKMRFRRWPRSLRRSTRDRRILARAGCIPCLNGWSRSSRLMRPSYTAEIPIDSAYVHQRLDPIVSNEDLSRYIL